MTALIVMTAVNLLLLFLAGALVASARRKAIAGYAATAGTCGTAAAGEYGTATVDYKGTATAGNYGTATAGKYGTATAGDFGTAMAGEWGIATAGYKGTAAAGDYGTATAGVSGAAMAGDGGSIHIWWYYGTRHRLVSGYIGDGGLEPNVAYTLNEKGEFVEAKG